MYIDQSHYYFFEHPQEHAPGMLMIETGRQFVIAVCHVFGGVPLKDISFMLTKLSGDFTSYVELNFPVKVRFKLENCKKNKNGSWSYVDASVTFFQKNQEGSGVVDAS